MVRYDMLQAIIDLNNEIKSLNAIDILFVQPVCRDERKKVGFYGKLNMGKGAKNKQENATNNYTGKLEEKDSFLV
jgi:hypothetical protein